MESNLDRRHSKRQIEIVGNKLTVRSAPVKSTQTGKDIVFTVTYERVE
jgi:hypothetical protein